MKRQVGFTPPGTYPPYINVHEISDGMVRVTIRSPNSSDPNLLVSQPVAYIDMKKQEWHQFTVDIDNEIFGCGVLPAEPAKAQEGDEK